METTAPKADPADPAVKTGSDGLPACNQALIIGDLVTEPETRTLPGGAKLFSFSLTVRRPGEQTTSVPLVWYDPPKRVYRWKLGTPIVATGPVVRRFFRAGGATAARTEVTVRQAEVLTQRARSRKVIDRYGADIDEIVTAAAAP